MKQCKLSNIKLMVELEVAYDITHAPFGVVSELKKVSDIIAYSVGKNGTNGVLLRCNTTNGLYAITQRNANLMLVL